MIRAVLVDDEEPARERLQALLRELGTVRVVGVAEDAEEALEKIIEARPNLVFLDIQMPGRSGLELVASLPPRARASSSAPRSISTPSTRSSTTPSTTC